VFKDHGIKTPYWKEVQASDFMGDQIGTARDIFNTFPMPAIVKPASGGSSVGVTIARTHAELIQALLNAAEHGDTILIEEFIPGIEATAGVLEGFRGEELYALPPVEIRPDAGFFDYEAKYKGKSKEIVPATFSEKIKLELQELSQKVHRALGLRHYSRSDFIISPRRGIYVLEANTLPGLTQESLLRSPSAP